MRLIPPLLKSGDTVGVVAPSGSFDPERLAHGLAYLERRGYRVRPGASLYARSRYLAGDDAARAADLNAMFADPDVGAIFAARGGYGAARVLDLLDWAMIRRHPKALVGFSDTTALQLGIYARTGLVSFSGITLCADITVEGVHPVTETSLWEAVTEGRFPPVEGLHTLRSGTAEGPLVGGCLSLVASLAGTSYLPDLTGALLFLEDVNEAPYRVDRMLNQLHMAGAFERVSGVLFGRFEGCEPDRDWEGTVEAVLEDLALRIACPVFCGLPYGHGPGRRVLPVGRRATVDETGVLRFGKSHG